MEVFNENSFLFFDINIPQPTIDKIIYLENNYTAYEEMSMVPILKKWNKYY